MKALKSIAASMFAIALCAQAAAASQADSSERIEAKIIALVNGQIITEYDLASLQNLGMSAADSFDALLHERLILGASAARNLHANAIEIEEMKQRLKAQTPALSGDVLANLARTKVLEKKIYDDVVANASIAAPSDEAVREFYAEQVAPQGLSFESEEEKIRSFLYSRAAEQAIANWLEKERSRAQIVWK